MFDTPLNLTVGGQPPKQRIIRMVEEQVDPFMPPKFKHKNYRGDHDLSKGAGAGRTSAESFVR